MRLKSRVSDGRACAGLVVDDVKLPTVAAQAIRAYATLRRKAEREDRRAAPRWQPGTPCVCCVEDS